MKNMVTVTFKMPWMSQLDDNKYRKLYVSIMEIARDDSQISHAEAGHLVSALQTKKSEYSYDEVSLNVNFDAYADLSLHVPDQILDVQVSKAGSHIQSDLKTDAKYYNAVCIQFADGRIKHQMIGHLDSLDSSIKDVVYLSRADIRHRFSDLKDVVIEEVTKNVTTQTKPSQQMLSQETKESSFSL